jgi:FixJ family two-component response regulator
VIYLIDDDKSVRRAFEIFLKSAGMDYQSFGSANEFLSVYKQAEMDLLILDLNLPGMNGRDLLKKFDFEGIHLPVIVVSASDDAISREICRQLGVKAYLRKPVDGEALLDTIKYNLL